MDDEGEGGTTPNLEGSNTRSRRKTSYLLDPNMNEHAQTVDTAHSGSLRVSGSKHPPLNVAFPVTVWAMTVHGWKTADRKLSPPDNDPARIPSFFSVYSQRYVVAHRISNTHAPLPTELVLLPRSSNPLPLPPPTPPSTTARAPTRFV